MADEVTGIATMQFAKGNVSALKRTLSFSVDVSGDKYVSNVQEIGTSEEALEVGDVATAGWMWGRNLDSTNFIKLRMGSGAADLVKVKAGEPFLFRLAGNTPYAIADTAACDLEYTIVED